MENDNKRGRSRGDNRGITSKNSRQQRGDRKNPQREGRGGGRGGREGKRDERREDAGAASYRVLGELSALEKALSKNDFESQRGPLENIAKALKPLRLHSIEQLDLNTRGRLLTTLLRLSRQAKPAAADTAAVSGDAPAPSAPLEEKAAETEVSAATTEIISESAGEEAAIPEGTLPKAAEPVAPAEVDPKLKAYSDVMFGIGSVWRAVGDERRAALSFAASGRKAEQREAIKVMERTGNWEEQARLLIEQGRTRDAAKLHERQKSFTEAARLYVEGGDLKGALRAHLALKDNEGARKILASLPIKEALPILEKASAYEILMEHYVSTKDFDNVAKLYERARQFDQAALAWERAGKFPQARRSFERARDFKGAERVRALEVAKLIERGDRLGAAQQLVSAGRREDAIRVVQELPAPKAFKFLQRLKFDNEALALARSEIAQAETDGRHSARARWLEELGDFQAAAEAWHAAGKPARALTMYEQAGNWQRAAALAESTREWNKAIELYHRAGDRESAERVAQMPKPALEPAQSEVPVDANEITFGGESSPTSAAPAESDGPSA